MNIICEFHSFLHPYSKKWIYDADFVNLWWVYWWKWDQYHEKQQKPGSPQYIKNPWPYPMRQVTAVGISEASWNSIEVLNYRIHVYGSFVGSCFNNEILEHNTSSYLKTMEYELPKSHDIYHNIPPAYIWCIVTVWYTILKLKVIIFNTVEWITPARVLRLKTVWSIPVVSPCWVKQYKDWYGKDRQGRDNSSG